jgi:hypothetical protein
MYLCIVAFRIVAAEATKNLRDFDIPPNDAVTALRHFASQSGLQVIYSGSAVSGVKTSRVKGRFTPREALDRMLAGTTLSVKEDEKTGAMAIMPARPTTKPPAKSAAASNDSNSKKKKP